MSRKLATHLLATAVAGANLSIAGAKSDPQLERAMTDAFMSANVSPPVAVATMIALAGSALKLVGLPLDKKAINSILEDGYKNVPAVLGQPNTPEAGADSNDIDALIASLFGDEAGGDGESEEAIEKELEDA